MKKDVKIELFRFIGATVALIVVLIVMVLLFPVFMELADVVKQPNPKVVQCINETGTNDTGNCHLYLCLVDSGVNMLVSRDQLTACRIEVAFEKK